MLDQMQGHDRTELAVSESPGRRRIPLHGPRTRRVQSCLLDGVVDQIDAGAAEVVLQQTQHMPEATAQLQQFAIPGGGVAPHQRRVVTPRKPVHAEAPQAAVRVIPLEEIRAVVVLQRRSRKLVTHIFLTIAQETQDRGCSEGQSTS